MYGHRLLNLNVLPTLNAMITLEPIGFASSPRDDTSDDYRGDVEARIELCPEFGPAAFGGIETFSHVEMTFFFDRVPENRIERGAGHPRGHTAWPLIGISAQRGKNPPKQTGGLNRSFGWSAGTAACLARFGCHHRNPGNRHQTCNA
jgi:hypothetical protein